NTGYLAYDIDVSADGSAMLISGYNYAQDRYQSAVREYSTANGHTSGGIITNLYKARYFRGGVIGIRSRLHNTDIIYTDFKGNSETLVRGNEETVFSGPQALDDNQIVFIASNKGIRELWLYDYNSRELYRIEGADPADSAAYWRYMRNLAVSEGKIFFSYTADDSPYKLGAVDLKTMHAVFNTRDFSGGVFDPVAIGNTIYYRGAYVTRDELQTFPEALDVLSGIHIDVQLTKLNEGEPKAPESQAVPPTNYFALRYINPLKYWLPLPLFRFANNGKPEISLDGAGIYTVMEDPAERNFIAVLAYADFFYKMARVKQFSWTNTGAGFPLSLNFSDTVVESGVRSYRSTYGTLTGSVSRNLGQLNSSAALGGGYQRNAGYEFGKNAYQWKWQKPDSGFFIQAGFSLAYRGISMQVSGQSLAETFSPRISGVFQADTDTRFPLHFDLFGAYDKQGMDLQGTSNTYSSALISPYTLQEYGSQSGLSLNWLAGADTGIDVFSVEIQKNISQIYFNRIYGELSLRNQIYDSGGNSKAEGVAIHDLRLAQSLALRLGMKISCLPIVKYTVAIEPYVFGAWKFSDAITGAAFPWYINAGLNVSL
ncbi:MAG: hypothetical protein FWF29_09600, partial [Treponema sp.]|nr:hypothetical protein [Treponema sp.]